MYLLGFVEKYLIDNLRNMDISSFRNFHRCRYPSIIGISYTLLLVVLNNLLLLLLPFPEYHLLNRATNRFRETKRNATSKTTVSYGIF